MLFRFGCSIQKKRMSKYSHIRLDYVVDASDTITYKIHLIKQCLNVKFRSSPAWVQRIKWIQRNLKLRIFPKQAWTRLRVSFVKARKEGIKKGVKVVFSTKSR